VDGEHYLGFDGDSEAIEKIEWALTNEDEALDMAHKAMKQVKPHTWDARVQTILETCGLV
jgi:hypothetical protein